MNDKRNDGGIKEQKRNTNKKVMKKKEYERGKKN